jgi:hypothetical protein
VNKKNTIPSPTNGSFVCIHCNCLTTHHNSTMWINNKDGLSVELTEELEIRPNGTSAGYEYTASICFNCEKVTIFRAYFLQRDIKDILNFSVVYPHGQQMGSFPPNDLDDDLKDIYIQASKVSSISPVAGCALFRLCMEKVFERHANYSGKEKALGKKIEEMYKDKKIEDDLYKALVSVKIFGNRAIHDGTISLLDSDDHEIAKNLASLINLIVFKLITIKKINDETHKLALALEAKAKT